MTCLHKTLEETDGKKDEKREHKQEAQNKQETVYTAGDEEIRDIRGGLSFFRMQQETRRRNRIPPGRHRSNMQYEAGSRCKDCRVFKYRIKNRFFFKATDMCDGPSDTHHN